MERFKYTHLTDEIKIGFLNLLSRDIQEGRVDKEMLPYLEKINKIPNVATVMSCFGHLRRSKQFMLHVMIDPSLRNLMDKLVAKLNSCSITCSMEYLPRYGFFIGIEDGLITYRFNNTSLLTSNRDKHLLLHGLTELLEETFTNIRYDEFWSNGQNDVVTKGFDLHVRD